VSDAGPREASHTTLADRGSVTFSSVQRIGLRKKQYVYPDASVVCGKLETEERAVDVVVNVPVMPCCFATRFAALAVSRHTCESSTFMDARSRYFSPALAGPYLSCAEGEAPLPC
jgi:hypothetical protein